MKPSDGIDLRYAFIKWGFNVRPTELQASFGLKQLRRVETFHTQSVANANFLIKTLEPYDSLIKTMAVYPRAECSWFALTLILTPEAPFSRAQLVAHLEDVGVETRPVVAGGLARHPVTIG